MKANPNFRMDAEGLTPSLIEEYRSLFESVLDSAPSDSSLHVAFNQVEANEWTIDISMRFSRGHIGIMQKGTNLSALVENAVTELRRKIGLWQIQRRVEAFRLDGQTEADLFKEISLLHHSTTAKTPLRTLIVEDDPAAANVLEKSLNSLNCQVDVCDSPDKALELLGTRAYGLLVLDWNLPYKNGGETLIQADQTIGFARSGNSSQKPLPVIICSSLPPSSIELPPLQNLKVICHWHKELPFSSLLSLFDVVTSKIGSEMRFGAA